MKTHLSLLRALVACLGSTLVGSLPATAQQHRGLMHPVDVVNINGQRVVVGSPADAVVRVLGEPVRKRLGDPSGKLDENVWVYHQIEGRGSDKKPANDGCHTFLVTLTDTGGGRGWRVSEMKLVDENAAQFYTNQIRTRASGSMVAVR